MFVLFAAILAVAAVAAAGVLAFVRTRELLRRFRAFAAAADEALAVVTAGADRIAVQTATLGPGELEPALARLDRSRAQLAVLLAAVDEVRGLAANVTGLRPRA